MFWAYILYLSTAIMLTVAAGRTLRQHGLTILTHYFPRHPELAFSVNHLLVTGFYLVNLGAASVLLPAYARDFYSGAGLVEFLSLKYGIVLVLLTTTWFANVFFLTRFRCFLVKVAKKERQARAKPTAPINSVLAEVAAQLQTVCPPEMAQMDFTGFASALGARMLEARNLKNLFLRTTRESFIASPALWNEMVEALYGMVAFPGGQHGAIAAHFVSSETNRARLLPAAGAVVYAELCSRR